MKRTAVIFLLLMLCMTTARAGNGKSSPRPDITFGVEWGYIGTFFSGYHHNFFSNEGYRVDQDDYGLTFISNADAYVHAGYNLDDNWNISLYIGGTGLAGFAPALPVSIRGTRYFGEEYEADRWFAFLDLGSGISLKKNPQEILAGKIGGGYRISLSRLSKLDFIVSARMTYTHQNITYKGTSIDRRFINRNNAYAAALSLGISITL